jgi:hypothetical protein
MLLAQFARHRPLLSVPGAALSRAASTYGSLDSPLVNPAFIDVALSQLLKNKKAKKNDVNEFIDHYKTRMNRQNFISVLRGCRRRQVLEPRHIYTAACGLKYADDAPLDSAQLDQIFQSISFMSHRVASVRVLLTVTTEALQNCDEKFSIDQLANFMFSLIHMKSGVPEVRDMVNVVMSKLADADDSISNESASKLIGGFRGLSSKYPEVQRALAIVLEKLQRYCDVSPFNENELSRALYGIKRLNMEQNDVQQLSAFILSKVGSCQMNGAQLSQAIHAVQSVDTDVAEAKKLFQFLAQQVEQLDNQQNLNAKSVNDVLTSMGSTNANSNDILILTTALKSKLA